MGASLEQIKHDANAITEMWETLPESARTRKDDLHFRLIAAVPTSDKRIKEERLKLHIELRTAQSQGKPPPWTVKPTRAAGSFWGASEREPTNRGLRRPKTS